MVRIIHPKLYTTMNLIEIATHTQSQLEQSIARITTLATEHAEAIAAKDASHAATIAAKDSEIATLTQQYGELATYKTQMEATVSAVLKSGDPLQYEALAKDFLTPAQEKERLATLARIEELKAEAAALESTLTV